MNSARKKPKSVCGFWSLVLLNGGVDVGRLCKLVASLEASGASRQSNNHGGSSDASQFRLVLDCLDLGLGNGLRSMVLREVGVDCCISEGLAHHYSFSRVSL